MSEIPKAYEPQAVEAKWYQYWLEQKCFAADPARVSEKRPAYSIVIPPPNVTGMLHMGHVLNNTIQDILARKARMDGKEVLWLPGTDHAGIATQAVVEKTLIKQGQIRHRDDLGRDKFLEKVWEWKAKHGDIIIEQLKKLGASCDWSRERFTMDPDYSSCVQRVFVDLYRKGLIYRGKRMVNWDPSARTALSDEEVEMIETKGHLWHFKYPLLDDQGRAQADAFVIVATTRPETMLGDEAVAVNPRDERYTHLIGRRILLPLQNKPIPLIADDLVDPAFGTGCVKVTPAHDPADYEMAVRHKLPFTVVIGPDGRMTPEAGAAFARLTRDQARKAVVAAMEQAGLLLKIEDYVHNVGHSQRSHVPIEPYLSEQWFLRYPSQASARTCVADGTMRFFPDRWAKVYDHWMGNLRDWCISRQLWWGHRVPVWTKRVPATDTTMRMRRDRAQACATLAELTRNGGAAFEECPLFEDSWSGVEGHRTFWRVRTESGTDTEWEAATFSELEARALEAEGWVQDPDVLDTWFSSWLWPFATMGWPERTPALEAFYPTADLVTGPDIIFFWVARMIMAGYEYMGDLPFRNVYFTGIIRDKQGRKMSKSLGNSPDPLALIARYGADALRFGTMRSAPLGQDVLFDEKDVELGRNFCNKLWNACRFRQMQGGPIEGEIDPALLTSDDKWILRRLDRAIREIDDAFAGYRFNEATATLYRFFWSEYCDWYVEASKAALQSGRADTPADPPGARTPDPDAASAARLRANTLAVIDCVLSHTLRLFHPFLPFITEELWQGMNYHADLPVDQGGHTIMCARWPKPLDAAFCEHYGLDETAEQVASAKYGLVGVGRNFRREFNLPSNRKLRFVLKPAGDLPAAEIEVMRLLLNAEALDVQASYIPPKGTPMAANALGELYLPLAGLIDSAAEKARLEKELEKARLEVGKVAAKLDNPQFTQRVPPAVLEEHTKRLADWQAKEQQILASLNNLPE
ncbi:MAG TPA: valine--tRNA ligase [Candidatus Paceibacterota bacterium]|nr:valine--tRNA ligase [Candidatus Paceibacterota bacterium]